MGQVLSLVFGNGREELKPTFARFDESPDNGLLEPIVSRLNSSGNAKLLEVARLSEGGTAKASSQYNGAEKPENAFVEEDAEWLSKDGLNPKKCAEWIERTMPSAHFPAIFAMQNCESSTAPRKFKVVAKVESGAEWETVLEADGVEWEDDQWKFWVLEKQSSVRIFRVEVEEFNKRDLVSIRNIRLYC